MRYTPFAVIAAALTIGGTGTAYAQMTGPGSAGEQQFVQDQGQDQRFGGSTAQGGQADRFQERATLRRELRQAGFQNIRILNAAYLVQARMPDGRVVLMMIDPPSQIALLGTSAPGGQQDQRMTRQQQQFGGMGQDQRSGTMQGQMQGQRNNQSRQQGSAQAQERMSQQDTQITGVTGQSVPLTASQVASMLRARGLSNIENVEREGNTFTASADWRGEQIDVRINAISGEIIQPETF